MAHLSRIYLVYLGFTGQFGGLCWVYGPYHWVLQLLVRFLRQLLGILPLLERFIGLIPHESVGFSHISRVYLGFIRHFMGNLVGNSRIIEVSMGLLGILVGFIGQYQGLFKVC